jgi:prefoldin subunit 5
VSCAGAGTESEQPINEAAAALKTQPEELTQRIGQVQDHVKALKKNWRR